MTHETRREKITCSEIENYNYGSSCDNSGTMGEAKWTVGIDLIFKISTPQQPLESKHLNNYSILRLSHWK